VCVASFIESTVLLLIGGRTSGGPPETGYDTREYNVTDFVCQAINLITCPITYIAIIPGALGTKTLQLEAEEAHYNVDCCICNQDVRFPYGEMGEVGKCDCMCFKGVQFKGIVVCPRSGCDGDFVDEIIKLRQRGRGDTAQIQRAEEVKNKVKTLKKAWQ
jgi:hypothetical protein